MTFPNIPGPSWVDVLVVFCIAGVWLALIVPLVLRCRPCTFDSFRDLAVVQGMLNGEFLGDPSFRGLGFWYPPLIPLFHFLICRVSGLSPEQVIWFSVIAFNVWIPILVYVLGRQFSDTSGALVGVVVVWFGTYLWSTRMACPLPAVQAMIPGLLCVILWARSVANSRARNSLACGALLGVTVWSHPICAMVIAGAVAMHAVLLRKICARPNAWKSVLIATGVALLISAPVVLHYLSMPKVNLAPGRWFLPELHEWDKVLSARCPLLLPLAAWGVWSAVRRRVVWQFFLIAWFIMGVLGLLVGYARVLWWWEMPCLLPHEFAWHAHMAGGLLAGSAIYEISRQIARVRSVRQAALWGIAVVLCTLTVGPALPGFKKRTTQSWLCHPFDETDRRLAAWIRRHTSPQDVIACTPLLAYQVVAPLTGRKVIALPSAHTNPATRPLARIADVDKLVLVRRRSEFERIIAAYDARFVLLIRRNDDPRPGRLRSWGWEEAYRCPIGRFLVYERPRQS